jgi:polyisoprenoid-binding protein YceI
MGFVFLVVPSIKISPLYRNILFVFLLLTLPIQSSAQLYKFSSGEISFRSEAPLEMITAKTKSFKAAIDTAKSEFAVSIPIQTFLGFNSELQQIHFFENYMETARFANATFTGKIIETVRYTDKPQLVTLKGLLDIHGVKKQRIVDATISWTDKNTMIVDARFTVPLKDHNIEIPRVVYQKIAEVIDVKVNTILKSQ